MQKGIFNILTNFVGFCGILQDSEGFCEILWDSAGLWVVLRDVARFCGILIDSEGFCGILWSLRHSKGFCGTLRDSVRIPTLWNICLTKLGLQLSLSICVIKLLLGLFYWDSFWSWPSSVYCIFLCSSPKIAIAFLILFFVSLSTAPLELYMYVVGLGQTLSNIFEINFLDVIRDKIVYVLDL